MTVVPPLPQQNVAEWDNARSMTPVWRSFWISLLQVIVALNGGTALFTFGNYANDAAAAAGGVKIGQMYRNGSVVQIRVT